MATRLRLGRIRSRFIVKVAPFLLSSAATVGMALQIATPTGTGGSLAQSQAGASAVLANKVSGGGGLIAVPEDFNKLKLAPGFLLSVNVYDAPELSGEYRIDDSGDITLPLAGPVHISGQTTADAQHSIERKLLTGQILKGPQVTLNVEQYTAFVVAVIGEVQTPGRVQLLAPHSLLDLLSQVGGETAMAGGEIQVKHSINGLEQTTVYHYGKGSDGESIRNVMVDSGDTVIVPRAGIVYVLGAVTRPGGFLMQEDGNLNVAQALSLASGTTLQAKVGDIRVIRRHADGSFITIPVDYRKMTNGTLVPIELAPQDIVYVPVSKIKAALSSGTAVISSATSATIYSLK